MCSLLAGAQPLRGTVPQRRTHHTHRLPGVGERRMARLEKMRLANVASRHSHGPLRAKTQPENQRGLVLLVEFPDMKMQNGAAEQWNERFNGEGFSLDNHVGSVRDYFREQSYGLLTIDFDVIGPLEVAQKHNYYGTPPNSRLDDRAPEMIIEALKLADPEVNYADYDWDGDGEVDQVYVIFAGITSDTESGYIWPHEWSLIGAKAYGCGSGMQRLDNVYIDTYATSNELADGTTLEGIGTACHEFSHCLGYPDFYDTEYNGGTAGQRWEVMDGGSYNGPWNIGEVPSPYTAYERWLAGWIDLEPLTEPRKVKDMPAINEEGVAYIIRNSGNSNEYYILENRQQTTFGTGNGGHGLMIWHIDYSQAAWSYNTVNTDPDHQRMTFLPADGQVGVLMETYYGNYYQVSEEDEAGDPYPGLRRVRSVQPLTWFTKEKDGTKVHPNLIHHIEESADGKISFIYGDYAALPMPEISSPTDISEDGFTANWVEVPGAVTYTLEVEAISDEEGPATVFAEDFSGFSAVSEGATITNSIIGNYTQAKGWTVSNTYGTMGTYVRIGANGNTGYLMTPALESKPGTLTVEFNAASYGTDGSSVAVSILSADNKTLASQKVPLTDQSATYSLTFEDIPSGCRVKFASLARQKRLYLHNVNIMDMSGLAKEVTTIQGLTSTSYTLSPITSDLYSYRVQAVCDDGSSAWSEWMSVDIAAAVESVSASIPNGDECVIYDLNGRRLQRLPQRGIYIQNGKVRMAR